MLIRSYIYSIIYFVVFIASFYSEDYDLLVYILCGSILISVLDKLGHGIVLREIISLHTAFTCLLMPLLGYNLYNEKNELAVLAVRYMPIIKSAYFSFALPAVAAYVSALCIPFKKKGVNDKQFLLGVIIPHLKHILHTKQKGKTGVFLICLGFMMFVISSFLPTSLRFISLLFYFSAFTGMLYVYFSPSLPYRIPVVLAFSLVVFYGALNSSMFTVVVYMGMTMFSVIFVGSKIGMWKKVTFFVFIAFFLVVLQSIKPAYRSYTWGKEEVSNRVSLFFDLAVQKIKKGDLFEPNSFFGIYYRTNQGYNTALVMKRIPNFQEHDMGNELVKNLASSLVPRILWPNKPEAGGKYNMKYYAGISIVGWSTNIGPVGEAYGGFGRVGGIIYMFILGLLIRFAFHRLIVLSRKNPLLLLWLPVLFFQTTYSAETDTLQILNSLIKSIFFVWLIYKFLPSWFGLEKSADKTKRYKFVPQPIA